MFRRRNKTKQARKGEEKEDTDAMKKRNRRKKKW